MRRFLTNHHVRFTLLAGALSMICSACFFDADLPLRNDPPVCTNVLHIRSTLIYPDSSVCTLLIDDLNDTALSLSVVPCTTTSLDSGACDSLPLLPWPGEYMFLATGYGTKKLHLLLDTNRMGCYSGMLLLRDEDRATLPIPYSIEKKFLDAFDSYPPDDDLWQSYVTDDSLHIGFDYIDGKLIFAFEHSDDSLHVPLCTGIRSTFSLPSAFYTTIDFKLRDEMDEAFEVGFFISSSPDTGRWSGERAGIFISGVNGRLRFECRSIDLQSYSYESRGTSGELGIGRTDSTISYFFHDGNPVSIPKPLTTQFYPAAVPVYIHLKMTVRDLSRERNCYWNDFSIPEGSISFPPD